MTWRWDIAIACLVNLLAGLSMGFDAGRKWFVKRRKDNSSVTYVIFTVKVNKKKKQKVSD